MANVKLVREGDDYYHCKDNAFWKDVDLHKAYGTDDRDINYEKAFVFEFVMDECKDFWMLFKNGLWQSLIEERFGFYKGSMAWPWAKVYALEILLGAYFRYIRKVKIGVDVDHHGAYFYDFNSGRPLFWASFV